MMAPNGAMLAFTLECLIWVTNLRPPVHHVSLFAASAMKITRVETLKMNPKHVPTQGLGEVAYSWVCIHTDTGLVGYGETFPVPEAETSIIHSKLANVLLGEDPFNTELLWKRMFSTVNWWGWAGAECRALSAVDIALWDLKGKVAKGFNGLVLELELRCTLVNGGTQLGSPAELPGLFPCLIRDSMYGGVVLHHC